MNALIGARANVCCTQPAAFFHLVRNGRVFVFEDTGGRDIKRRDFHNVIRLAEWPFRKRLKCVEQRVFAFATWRASFNPVNDCAGFFRGKFVLAVECACVVKVREVRRHTVRADNFTDHRCPALNGLIVSQFPRRDTASDVTPAAALNQNRRNIFCVRNGLVQACVCMRKYDCIAATHVHRCHFNVFTGNQRIKRVRKVRRASTTIDLPIDRSAICKLETCAWIDHQNFAGCFQRKAFRHELTGIHQNRHVDAYRRHRVAHFCAGLGGVRVDEIEADAFCCVFIAQFGKRFDSSYGKIGVRCDRHKDDSWRILIIIQFMRNPLVVYESEVIHISRGSLCT